MVGQGHWVGLEANPEDFFGFIYTITCDQTGKSYVGKKQYFMAKPGALRCKSKTTDRGSPKWKECCWKQSNWRKYSGSSKYLTKYMEDNPTYTFTHEIIKQCRSKGILTFSECEIQWERKVLTALLPDGTDAYFNYMIGAIRFRPKLTHSEKTKAKMIGNTNAVGAKRSPECRAAIAEAMRVRVISDETRRKLSDSVADSKEYTWEHKSGELFIGRRVDLLREHGVTLVGSGRVIREQQLTSRGWRLVKEVPHGTTI